jgi:hypothetical protein
VWICKLGKILHVLFVRNSTSSLTHGSHFECCSTYLCDQHSTVWCYTICYNYSTKFISSWKGTPRCITFVFIRGQFEYQTHICNKNLVMYCTNIFWYRCITCVEVTQLEMYSIEGDCGVINKILYVHFVLYVCYCNFLIFPTPKAKCWQYFSNLWIDILTQRVSM